MSATTTPNSPPKTLPPSVKVEAPPVNAVTLAGAEPVPVGKNKELVLAAKIGAAVLTAKVVCTVAATAFDVSITAAGPASVCVATVPVEIAMMMEFVTCWAADSVFITLCSDLVMPISFDIVIPISFEMVVPLSFDMVISTPMDLVSLVELPSFCDC